jgi:hypothetical protein
MVLLVQKNLRKTAIVKLNDVVGPYFQSAKGVRQGDHILTWQWNASLK